MEELAPGLRTWKASHPSWTSDQGDAEVWEQEVRSYALETDDALVLIDPLVESAAVEVLARGRPVVVLLTCHWHMRSAPELVEQLGVEVHAPPTSARELELPITPYGVGDRLPGDVTPQPGGYVDECTLWLPTHRGVVTGDVFLADHGFRVQPDSWLEEELTHAGCGSDCDRCSSFRSSSCCRRTATPWRRTRGPSSRKHSPPRLFPPWPGSR